MGRKPLTHEEFMERFYIKNENAENIEILGEYINIDTKIKCRCKIDGYKWETIPYSLLNSVSSEWVRVSNDYISDWVNRNNFNYWFKALGE